MILVIEKMLMYLMEWPNSYIPFPCGFIGVSIVLRVRPKTFRDITYDMDPHTVHIDLK